MEAVMRLGMVGFVVYSPMFVFILWLAVKKYGGYSFRRLWVSCLGDTGYPSAGWFKFGFVVYGILYWFFSRGLLSALPEFGYKLSVEILLNLGVAATILASLVPINKHLLVHHLLTLVVFGSMNGVLGLTMWPISQPGGLPGVFVGLNIVLLAAAMAFSGAFARLVAQEKRIPLALVGLRSGDKSLWVRHVSLLEWGYILGVVGWSFGIGIACLFRN